MSTKFILHGGRTSQKNPHNDSFFKEFSKNLKDGDNILYIAFARESEEDQQKVFQRDRETILSHSNKKISIENANSVTFKDQLQKANAIFITGGVTKILKDRLSHFPNFAELIRGKTYAGSSAGANIISKFHLSGFAEGIQEGFGILPINIISHYGNTDYNATEKSKNLFTDEYELVLLPECEWKTFEV